MLQSILKLSVLYLSLLYSATTKADSFFLPITSKVCIKEQNKSQEDIVLEIQDKAKFLAVKNSDYVKNKLKDVDDYYLSLISYKILDTALQDVDMSKISANGRMCLDYKANLDIKKTDEIIATFNVKKLNNNKIKDIAKEVISMPKSIYEANDSIPLIYIDDLEFYNKKTTSKYTQNIVEQLSFEPRILITENKELTDFVLTPKLTKSSVDIIDEKNSRYSMSVTIEVTDLKGKKVINEEKSRYIIIDNNQNMQTLANKMITKLLNEAISSIKAKLNILFHE